jgi:hypothetical protein
MLQKNDETQKRHWLESVELARRRTNIVQQQARDALHWERALMENWLGVRQSR